MSQESRDAALRAAAGLLEDGGWRAFSVDEVARRSGVGKATIYRHWTGGFPLAVEAWGSVVTDAVPTVPTGDAVADLRDQVVRLAAFYASDRGRIATQLLGASAGQPDGSVLVERVFFRVRRDATRSLVRDGVARGQIRVDADPDLVIDLLFGPIVFRLFNGLGPLDPDGARALADVALGAVATDAVRPSAAP